MAIEHHRLIVTDLGSDLYRVDHDGRVLVERTTAPELDACAALALLGYSGKATTYGPDSAAPDLTMDIAAVAYVARRHGDRTRKAA